jgi:hypothetical protein
VQSDIVLFTFNARYIHTAFGLRCLYANLKELQPRARIVEVDLQCRPVDAVEQILRFHPKIVGVSVYIWNVELVRTFVRALKQVSPQTKVVLGGPEVSHELDQQPWTDAADCVIQGEGDLAFASVCRAFLGNLPLSSRVLKATLPPLELLANPYAHYTDDDIKHRVIYVEASRGCPYRCEFCLSSLDEKVRSFSLAHFLSQLEELLSRGVLNFKFVDRTFNLNLKTSQAILEFFLKNDRPQLFVHFEMVPDRFPEALRATVRRFRPGVLQFEVGVQTLNPSVETAISRRQNHEQLKQNFEFLAEAHVHVHADLIIGLPFESEASFAEGFDRLHAMKPAEIQVGILKRLRGAPVDRHTKDAGMQYSAEPPYDVLATAHIDFHSMQRLKRFAKHWDTFANSGNFRRSIGLLWHAGGSVFSSFMQFSEFLHVQVKRTSSVSLLKNMELLLQFLRARDLGDRAREALLEDYRAGGRHETPQFLLSNAPTVEPLSLSSRRNKRQQKHA